MGGLRPSPIIYSGAGAPPTIIIFYLFFLLYSLELIDAIAPINSFG